MLQQTLLNISPSSEIFKIEDSMIERSIIHLFTCSGTNNRVNYTFLLCEFINIDTLISMVCGITHCVLHAQPTWPILSLRYLVTSPEFKKEVKLFP